MNDQLRYGPIKGEESCVKVPNLITASEVIKAKSGRFVTRNTTTGAVEIADAGETILAGWIEAPEGTSVSGDYGNLIPANNCGVIFRVPIITGTLTAAMFGKTCDLVRSSNIQGVDLTASGEDVLLIVGGDLEGNHYADVMIYEAKVTGLTGVV